MSRSSGHEAHTIDSASLLKRAALHHCRPVGTDGEAASDAAVLARRRLGTSHVLVIKDSSVARRAQHAPSACCSVLCACLRTSGAAEVVLGAAFLTGIYL
jgi:hypothetical protein